MATGKHSAGTHEGREHVYFKDKEVLKPKKKRLKVFLIVLLVIVLLAGIAVGAVFYELNKIKRVVPEEEERLDPTLEDFEIDDTGEEDTMAPEDVDWGLVWAEEPDEKSNDAENVDEESTDEELPYTAEPEGGLNSIVENANIKNILLIGQDRRPGEGRARSDSMIICSLNYDTNEITLVSLMRDLYVKIPGYSDNRINAAYAFGGMSLLDEVIETNFGVPIHGNVEVDFNGFTAIMDMIGELPVVLTEQEAKVLNNGWGWELTPGANMLNSEQLLWYSRIRKNVGDDFQRTERQRKVLRTAFSALRNSGIQTILAVADEAVNYITTDLTNTEILSYIYDVYNNGMTIANSYRIPVNGTYTNQRIRGMAVLVPNLSKNSKALMEYLYGVPAD